MDGYRQEQSGKYRGYASLKISDAMPVGYQG
jgi:hypothetical protein